MREITYITEAERLSALETARKAGESQLHDDDLRDGTHRLTFVAPADDPRQPAEPNAAQIRLQALTRKLAADTITDAEIRELLRLERGL